MSLADEYRPGRYEPTDVSGWQTDLATNLRVPLVTSSHPRWTYVTAIVVGEDMPKGDYEGMLPTEAEVRMVASFCDEYRERTYRPGFAALMRDFAPFDIDSSANLGYLRKDDAGGWHYRKRTWRSGPMWSTPHEGATLVELLDHIKTYGGEVDRAWTEWKAAHPEVFGAPVTA